MNTKIYSIFNFFTFFGIYHEVTAPLSLAIILSRFLKVFGVSPDIVNPLRITRIFLKIFLIFWHSVLILFIILMIYRGVNSTNFSKFDFVLQFSSLFLVQIGTLMILVLTYKCRVKEQKILEIFTEIDDLIENCLNIKINNKRFVREFYSKLFLQILILMCGVLFRIFNEEKNYTYNELPPPVISAVLTLISYNKFFFYVDLMHFRMKVRKVIENCFVEKK